MEKCERPEGLMEKFFRLEMLLHRGQIANLRAYGPFGNPIRGQGRGLTILKMQPTISQKQLSYLLDMRQQSLSELLAKLEKNGLIERTPSEEDRRAVIIKLTDEGREAAEGADASAPDPDKPFDCLSAEEQALFSALLDKLLEALGDRADARPFFGPHAHPFPPGAFYGGFGPWDRGRGEDFSECFRERLHGCYGEGGCCGRGRRGRHGGGCEHTHGEDHDD